MSGIGKSLKNFKTYQAGKNAYEKFTNISVGKGLTVLPKTTKEQKKYGLRWDRDVEIVLPDGRKANRFMLQPNADAESKSIQSFVSKSARGTHTVIATADVPEDATQEEVKEILENAIDAVDGDDD